MDWFRNLRRFGLNRIHYPLMRDAIGWVLSKCFRDPAIIVKDDFTIAEQWLAQKKPLIIVVNHISYRDFLEVLRTILRLSSELQYRRIVIPTAYHVHKSFFMKWLVGPMLSFCGIYLVPIINRDTIATLGTEKIRHARNKGKSFYMGRARKAFANGDVAMLAPQAGIRPTLGQPYKKPIEDLLAGVPTAVGILAIGIGIDGVNDYTETRLRGYNREKRYTLSIGSFTHSTAMFAAAVNGGPSLDQQTFDLLRQEVPKTY